MGCCFSSSTNDLDENLMKTSSPERKSRLSSRSSRERTSQDVNDLEDDTIPIKHKIKLLKKYQSLDLIAHATRSNWVQFKDKDEITHYQRGYLILIDEYVQIYSQEMDRHSHVHPKG
jgi:hypothetical protein